MRRFIRSRNLAATNAPIKIECGSIHASRIKFTALRPVPGKIKRVSTLRMGEDSKAIASAVMVILSKEKMNSFEGLREAVRDEIGRTNRTLVERVGAGNLHRVLNELRRLEFLK